MSSRQPTRINDTARGSDTPWYRGWDITDEQREEYRRRSQASRLAKIQASLGQGPEPLHPVNQPKLDPDDLMPVRESNSIRALSLFSGGGGLDLGFDRAGFEHVASYEILEFAADTLTRNRPIWAVKGGDEGDVTSVDWRSYKRQVDIVHGGPPCQPFSVAGRQLGNRDSRDMLPEFVRAVSEIQPLAFLLENVPGLGSKKFASYLNKILYQPLSTQYEIKSFTLDAASFGVPQVRRRLFWVGFQDSNLSDSYRIPHPTHYWHHMREANSHRRDSIQPHQLSLYNERNGLEQCMGARVALGLPDIGYDALAPTLRSALTGPRHTTSILSSSGAQAQWESIEIWPNGVSADRESARRFVSKNGHFRLSVQDCSILQGFPESWKFDGAVYKILGQIGNSVAPPVGYWVANSIAQTLSSSA